jgi:hypothetical protein
MNSNLASLSAPELSLSKIHTGSLLDNLDEATRAKVLEEPCMKHPLVIATNPFARMIQEKLMKYGYFSVSQGRFIRDKITQGQTKLGPMGCTYSEGYIKIRVSMYKFNQSQLVYLWFTGRLLRSDEKMDHIDGVRANDYPGNLRIASNTLNQRNKAILRNNTSGHTGVRWDKTSCRWRAYIKVDSILINLGSFINLEVACTAREAWLAAHPELGFTSRHGK